MDSPPSNYGIWIPSFLALVIIGNYYYYKKAAAAKGVSFKFLFWPLFSIAVGPIVMLSLPIFAIYRQIVSLILTVKYGRKFWGLLEGRDSTFNLENKNPAYLLLVIQYRSNSGQNFYDDVKNFIRQALITKARKNPKLFGSIRKFLGYSYIVMGETTFDDCFRELKTTKIPADELSRDDLMEIMSQYTEVPLPKNREALWEVLVSKKAVKWTKNVRDNDAKSFPIIIRINHTFGDGQHIWRGIIQLFGDNKGGLVKSKANENCFVATHNNETNVPALNEQGVASSTSNTQFLEFIKTLTRNLIFYFRQFFIMILIPPMSLVNSLLMAKESNILHGPQPTYKKHFFLNSEDSAHYIAVAKRIKSKVPGSTFEDVFLTAIAASFKEYFEKNSASIPEYISAEVAAVAELLVSPDGRKGETVHCRNMLTYCVRKLPINVNTQNTNTPLINILQSIKKEGSFIRNSVEHEINYAIVKTVCHLLPAPILLPIITMLNKNTVLVSNLPGPQCVTVMDGCRIQVAVPWTATRGYAGLGFAIFTYDERLHLSLIVDKALTSNRSEVQSLLDGVYKYLDLLDLETQDSSN